VRYLSLHEPTLINVAQIDHLRIEYSSKTVLSSDCKVKVYEHVSHYMYMNVSLFARADTVIVYNFVDELPTRVTHLKVVGTFAYHANRRLFRTIDLSECTSFYWVPFLWVPTAQTSIGCLRHKQIKSR